MKLNNKYWFFIILLSIFSCKKVIQVDLNSAAPQIVIEGEITNASGPYHVNVTKTINFAANNIFPAVSKAVVKITDNTGVSDLLTETAPGIYTTNNITGKPGNTYTLDVTIDGKDYKAVSTMPKVVMLDSVTIEKTTFFNNTQVYAVANFKDPVGLGNYYQFKEYVNGTHVPQTFVLEDRLSDGKNIARQLYADSSDLKKGDRVMVEMLCIDANIYSYFRTFRQVTDNGNQSASPANPNTNITNGALGYFSAHTTETKEVTIK